jgi:hypothetical protein
MVKTLWKRFSSKDKAREVHTVNRRRHDKNFLLAEIFIALVLKTAADFVPTVQFPKFRIS